MSQTQNTDRKRNCFKTIQQLNAEKTIEALFAGLDDDITLKTVFRVMHGLEDESVLDELREVNLENQKMIEAKMELENVPEDEGIKIMDATGNIVNVPLKRISSDNVNGDDNSESESDKGHIDAASEYSSGLLHTIERDNEE